MIYSFLTLILVGVSVIFGEFEIVYPIIFPTLIILFSGVVLYFLFRKWRYAEMKLNTAMMLAGLAWFIIPFLGTIPFYISGNLDFLSAFFESMSGFTTTGLTMYSDVESLPRTILLWRSSIQWVGGIGILALFITILSKRSPVLRKLYTAEGRTDVVNFDVIRTSRKLWGFYAFVTFLCFVLLHFVGLPIFDAINTAFTALATGGFSVRNGSIGSYNNLHAEIVVMVFLIIGATNFFYMMGFFRNLASGRFSRNMESETFLIILSISILLLISIGSLSTRISAFQAIAASTNCGFQTTTLSGFSDFNKIILTMLMIIGGSSGSTAGGIKIFRIIILFFAVYWYFKKLNLPEGAVFIRRLGKRTFSNEEIVFIISYTIVYVTSLFVGALILAAHGHSFVDSAFEAASAIGNTGLSVGLTSISMSSLEKIVLMFEMWIGRVEIFSVLLLFIYPASMLFKHIKRKLK